MSVGRRFELVRELGAGAFGTVYLADMVSAGSFRKKVAIKLLNTQWDQSGDAGRRLRDEARLLGRLRHRAIVQVDDLVVLDGRWAVVMEHVNGADLERVLEALWQSHGTFPPQAALEVIASVAGALDAAYNGAPDEEGPLRVVHRDIKPSNVRLTADGDIKVLDFGIASAQFAGREAKTEQIRYGSIGYMSPERVLGEVEGPPGDVYALGCVLVELLRGKALGRSALLPDQQAAQVAAVVEEVTPLLGEHHEPVVALLQDLLGYEVEARPSAADVAERARRLARGLPGEDLATFCRQFLPQVNRILGDNSKEAKGALTEQRASLDDSGTLAAEVVADAPMGTTGGTAVVVAPADLQPVTPSRRPVWIAAAVAIVAVVAVAFLLLPRGDGPVASPPEPAPAPVAAPVAAPAPVAVAPPPVEAAPPVTPAPVAVEAAPVTPEARPTQKAKTPAASTPAQAEVAPPVATPEVAPGPTLRAVKFTASAATQISARCGSVSGAGTTSALLRDVPAGTCTVTATLDGKRHEASVSVSSPGGLTCTLDGSALVCR